MNKDMSGTFINGIEIIKRIGKDNNGQYIYELKCHCGKIFHNTLKHGKAMKSCGCLWTKNKRYIGEVIYGIEILGRTGATKKNKLKIGINEVNKKDTGNSFYNLKCFCGKEYEGIICSTMKGCGCSSTKLKGISDKKGVSYNTLKDCYIAEIRFQRKGYFLGHYKDADTAYEMRKIAEYQILGDFIKWYRSQYHLVRKKILTNE